jgi:hypothetical protein
MQNAADAGALAGAQELCFGVPSDAEAKARDYAENRNLAPSADVEIANWTVTVTTTETANTLVAGLIGFATADVGAVASAACGPADTACGLWPVGFRIEEWQRLYNSGAGCGDSFYLFNGDNENQQPDCSIYDCDVDDDGRNDVVPTDSRAWLDFSDTVNPLYPSCAQSGCGANELGCWIANSNPSPVSLPDCIAGDSGVKAGVRNDVESRVGDSVNVPLYDGNSCGTSSCPGGRRYNAMQFGCVEVLGWRQNYVLPRLDGGNPAWRGHMIEVSMDCGGCDTLCGTTPGGQPVPGGVNAVSLTQ